MTGVFVLAEQRGNKGYYGKVILGVEEDDTVKGCEVTFDELHIENTEWHDAARFGIQYAYSRLPRQEFHSRGHRIEVQCLQGHPFDTDSLIIAYTAARALLDAFGKSDSGLVSFDAEGDRIIFSAVKRLSMTKMQTPDMIAPAPSV